MCLRVRVSITTFSRGATLPILFGLTPNPVSNPTVTSAPAHFKLQEWRLQNPKAIYYCFYLKQSQEGFNTLSGDLEQRRRWESQLHYSTITVRQRALDL